MIRLSKEKVLQLHKLLVQETGGGEGLRDEGLLESALASAFSGFDGNAFYPSIVEKGARLGYALISNHAFFDGNKRIGIFVLLIFLETNGVHIICTNDTIAAVGLAVASGSMDYTELLGWVREHRTVLHS